MIERDNPGLYREMFQRHPAVKLLIDPDSGRIVDANAAAARFYRYSREALKGRFIGDLNTLPPERIAAQLAEARGQTRGRFDFRHRLADGEIRDVTVQSAPIHVGDRELLYSIVEDVTDRYRYETELAAYRDIFTALPVAFYRATTGAAGQFLRFNRAFMRLLEADSEAQLFARPVKAIYVDPAERDIFSQALASDGEVFRYELRLRTLRGKVIWAADTAYRHYGEHGEMVFDGVLEDITARKELEQRLQRRASHDDLTGLRNRGYANNRLAQEIQRVERHGEPVSALMFDLDRFKRINDDHGHAAGDGVLCDMASLLRAQLRQGDILARWGGEEFLLVLPGTGLDGAGSLAQKLREAIEAAWFDPVGTVTISVGFGQYNAGEGQDTFLRRLDDALYRAKHEGRNRLSEARD